MGEGAVGGDSDHLGEGGGQEARNQVRTSQLRERKSSILRVLWRLRGKWMYLSENSTISVGQT